MRQILTDAACNKEAPSDGRLELADLRQAGLVLRITDKGVRTFAFRFRHPLTRKTLRFTIGNYPDDVSLKAAREKARELAEQVGAGVNPIEARATERKAAPTRTFTALAERYMTEHAHRHKKPRSAAEDRRNLDLHVLPKWGKRDYRTIRRAEVIELIEGIIAAGKSTAANRVHSVISKVFSFAIDAELLEANPCARLKKRGVERVAKRVLDDAEIRLFWRGIIRSPVSEAVGLALRLALLTLTRVSEVAGAAKRDLHGLNGAEPHWIIPDTKNHRDHLIPLSPLACATVKAALALTANNDEYLFPARRNDGCIEGHVLTTAMLRFGQNLKGAAAKSWLKDMPSPHDLRRTANTRLAMLGVTKEIRDRLLNHATEKRDTEARHYNVHDFAKEKRGALDQWGNEAARILAER